MHSVQRITIKQREAANLLKQKVILGEINWNKNHWNENHQSATIRRLMNKEVVQKPSRQCILSKRKEIETAKFNVILLSQEKSRKVSLIRNKTRTTKLLYEENYITSMLSID